MLSTWDFKTSLSILFYFEFFLDIRNATTTGDQNMRKLSAFSDTAKRRKHRAGDNQDRDNHGKDPFFSKHVMKHTLFQGTCLKISIFGTKIPGLQPQTSALPFLLGSHWPLLFACTCFQFIIFKHFCMLFVPSRNTFQAVSKLIEIFSPEI